MMKRLFSFGLLLSFLTAVMPAATAQTKKDKPEPPNCSSSISGLILDPGCNSPEINSNNRTLVCKYKNKDYLIGEIYLNGQSTFGNLYSIRLENGETFSTNQVKVNIRSVDVGDPVIVIKQSGNYYVEQFQPQWIASLPGINLSDRKINSVISRYLETGETVDSFCQKHSLNKG